MRVGCVGAVSSHGCPRAGGISYWCLPWGWHGPGRAGEVGAEPVVKAMAQSRPVLVSLHHPSGTSVCLSTTQGVSGALLDPGSINSCR